MGGLELQFDDDDREDLDSENLLMRALEDREGRAQWLETADVCMPMTICEEAIDISYLGTLEAAGLSEAMGSTKVGEVRKELEKKCERLLMSVLCGEDVSGDTRGIQPDRAESEDPGGSIFDHGSRMGLIPGEDVDHWLRDEVTATWTRVIRVPRRAMYHPSEGIADQEEGLSLEEKGPVLSTLRSARMTIPEKGRSIRDDWRVS